MLQIEKLSVSYGETLILRSVDMQIRPGEVVCLMGRNGVGKTTLLKSLMGQLRPRSGRILYDGANLTRAKPYIRARRGIGYVPQGREIFPQLTVLENLQIGMFNHRDRSPELWDEIFSYFPKLKEILNRKGGFLSGGEQQQLAIARALITKPRLLILDEPTEGIQPSVISLIEKVLRSLKDRGQLAVLLVEQYFEFARKLGDRYYVMEKGEIVLSGDSAQMNEEEVKPYLAF